MGDPRRKRGRGAGKAPERPWSRREGAPFMPQARRASLLGRRAEVHLEKIGAYGVVADSGAVPLITAAERGISTRPCAEIAAPLKKRPQGRFLSTGEIAGQCRQDCWSARRVVP